MQSEKKWSQKLKMLEGTFFRSIQIQTFLEMIRYVKEAGPNKRLLVLKHMSEKNGNATPEDMVKVLE